jgi:translocation and assembly module TamA
MPRFSRWFCTSLSLTILANPLLAGEIRLDAPDEISELIAPLMPEDAAPGKKLREMLSETLATEGYFSPTIDFNEDQSEIKLKIDPGPRTLITRVNATVDGPIEAKTKTRLLAEWALPVGAPFRQADWNTAKHQLLTDLLMHEHAAAKLVDSAANIDPEARSAELTAHYDAGPRYRFGALQIEGLTRYNAELVERYNREVEAGAPYQLEKLNKLIATLQATPYFASVQGQLDLEAGDATDDDGIANAPVKLTVTERPAHRLSFGAGVSSNTGGRVEVNYQTPDMFNRAWQFSTGLRLEQKQQTLYGDIFFPPDRSNRRNSIGAMAENTDIQGLATSRVAFGAQTVEQFGSIEQRLSINWQDETRKPDGGLETQSRALVPNVMWTWRKVDNLLNPSNGTVLQGQVGGGAKAALSDENFLRLSARWLQYIALSKNNQLTLRSDIGYTVADSSLHIPQDYLFRTGGTGTVRGYAYQSLGVKEGTAIVGGRYMAVASGELTHWLNDSWGIAGFIDAGDAVDELKGAKPAIGYGLGARWRSPAGPIAVDLAYGERSEKIHLHFALAIPF